MGFKYPYGNSQQLNLDWLINAWRTFQQQIENIIAPAYSNTATYGLNALVIYDHVMYYALEDIVVPEEWNPEHWQSITIAQIFMGG